jgi:preprotein translocase subunit SecG
MYQRSRRIGIFLVLIFLVLTIACGVIAAIKSHGLYGGKLQLLRTYMHQAYGQIPDELALSGTYQCVDTGNVQLLTAETWILGTVWEVLALCLALWIAIKHFRELQRSSSWALGDCFTILIKTHVFYFAR